MFPDGLGAASRLVYRYATLYYISSFSPATTYTTYDSLASYETMFPSFLTSEMFAQYYDAFTKMYPYSRFEGSVFSSVRIKT